VLYRIVPKLIQVEFSLLKGMLIGWYSLCCWS